MCLGVGDMSRLINSEEELTNAAFHSVYLHIVPKKPENYMYECCVKVSPKRA